MALKPDRDVQSQDITFFCNDTTASRGGVVCISTAGSGIAMDQANAVVTYKAVPSGGKPMGILLNDVVNLDLTRQKQNVHKDEVQSGSKVTLVTRGWVVTDQVYPGITVSAGDTAYLQHSGKLTNVSIGAVASPAVGMFTSTKDEDGYAKVFINLLNV
jgi:hypothetical protein